MFVTFLRRGEGNSQKQECFHVLLKNNVTKSSGCYILLSNLFFVLFFLLLNFHQKKVTTRSKIYFNKLFYFFGCFGIIFHKRTMLTFSISPGNVHLRSGNAVAHLSLGTRRTFKRENYSTTRHELSDTKKIVPGRWPRLSP